MRAGVLHGEKGFAFSTIHQSGYRENSMNLYLISQDQNQDYDTYDSAVVAANSEDDARNVHPGGGWEGYSRRTWCESPDDVKVTFLCAGYDGKAGVVLASFNAG